MIGVARRDVDARVKRFNGEGSLDPSFPNPAIDYNGLEGGSRFGVNALGVQADGKVVVGDANALERVDTHGNLDTTFGSGGTILEGAAGRMLTIPAWRPWSLGTGSLPEYNAGGRPRRLVLTGLDSLTTSERRVAQLAASGLADREIAQQLFITTRTVEGHLTHAYQKLDITSREQLPDDFPPATSTSSPR